MTTSKAVYHHICFSKYNYSKLKPFNEPSKKRKSTENGRISALVLAGSRERFDLFCIWFSKKDIDANLVPAETYQATNVTSILDLVKDLTSKWIEMTTKLNHRAVLHLMRSGDVASKELCYHDKCNDIIRY